MKDEIRYCGLVADVSVVIPTHERPKLLKRALLSIFEQTLWPSEIIVVDDTGSSLTQEVVAEFNSKNENIRVVFFANPSNGASSSRNLGANRSTCKYVAFLDDDDVWLPTKLEKQYSLITGGNLDAVFCQLLVRYEGLGIEYATKSTNVADPLKSICIENYIGATISSVIKRQFFLDIGGFDVGFKAREEYDLWIRIISSSGEIAIVEQPLAISYRSFSRKRISSDLERYEQGISLLNAKHNNLVTSSLSHNELSLRKSKQFDFLAAQAISIGKRFHAAKYYFRSLIIKPQLKTIALASVSMLSPLLLIRLRSRL